MNLRNPEMIMIGPNGQPA